MCACDAFRCNILYFPWNSIVWKKLWVNPLLQYNFNSRYFHLHGAMVVFCSAVFQLGSWSTCKRGRGWNGRRQSRVRLWYCHLESSLVFQLLTGGQRQLNSYCLYVTGLIVMVPVMPELLRQLWRKPELLRATELACHQLRLSCKTSALHRHIHACFSMYMFLCMFQQIPHPCLFVVCFDSA